MANFFLSGPPITLTPKNGKAINVFEGQESTAALRARIEANLHRASAQRVRDHFQQMNPHLVGDKAFESRWSDTRKDAAVLVPIIPRDGGATVLFTVRSNDMPSHAGQISFPGGKVEKTDASREATALREAYEEVNIPPEAVDVVGRLGVHQGGLGFAVTPIIGIVDPLADIRACPREVDEVFEAPLAFFADPENHVTEQRTHKNITYNMFAAPYDRFHIWGLTAGILRTLLDVLCDKDAP